MPNICGILCLRNDSIISPEFINLEINSSSLFKDEEFVVWSDSKIALAEQNKESKHDLRPTEIADSKFCIVADACLTNRTELLKQFGVVASVRKKFPTSQLILEAYKKWGEDCVEHLLGDFAFAIWDIEKQKLICARDHVGAGKLFYYKDNKKFIFASTPKDILTFSNVEEKLNKNKFAYYLIPEPHDLTLEESWFENIFPLPAATILTADVSGIKTRQFWKPEIGKTLPMKKRGEILEAFRELMFETVEASLNEYRSVTALLSGGLDSSSIVSVAAKILEKQNKELTVFAAVLNDENDPNFSDERYFIDQYKSFPNINIQYISAPEKGPFTDLESFFENYDSPMITSRHYLFKAFSEEAEKINSSTILDGTYGEFGPTYHCHSGLSELLASYKWVTLWRELKNRKRLYDQSIKYNLRANALNPLLPKFIKNFRRKNRKNEINLNEHHPFQEHFFQELLNKTKIRKCSFGQLNSDHKKSHFNDLRFLHGKITEFPSATYGKERVEYRYPFLNKKMLEFCLAVPLELKIHDGYTRYLIRAGLDKILPPEIQGRTSKAPFSPDYMRRYLSQMEQIKQLLEGIKKNDPIREILDIEKIKHLVDRSVAETDRNSTYDEIAFDNVPQAIFLIYFLRRFSEFKS